MRRFLFYAKSPTLAPFLRRYVWGAERPHRFGPSRPLAANYRAVGGHNIQPAGVAKASHLGPQPPVPARLAPWLAKMKTKKPRAVLSCCRGLSLILRSSCNRGGSDNEMIAKPEARRFPPPWSVEETDAGFIVRDTTGKQLAYLRLFRGGARATGGRPSCSASTRRRNAANVAKLPELLQTPRFQSNNGKRPAVSGSELI